MRGQKFAILGSFVSTGRSDLSADMHMRQGRSIIWIKHCHPRGTILNICCRGNASSRQVFPTHAAANGLRKFIASDNTEDIYVEAMLGLRKFDKLKLKSRIRAECFSLSQ